MDSPSPSFPNEVWMRVFSYIVDACSLQAVILTSRRFHNLGIEELIRSVVWNSTEKAQRNLEFWENNMDQTHIPKAMSLNLKSLQDSAPYPAILDHISWFHNLNNLSLSNGRLPAIFYNVLLSLPQLTHLTLDGCQIPDAPDHFPFSYPSFMDEEVEPAISITHLTLRNRVIRYDPSTQTFLDWMGAIPLLKLLPHMRSLTTGYLTIPISTLQQLTSLTVVSCPSPEHTVRILNAYLPYTPNLLHLTVGAPMHQSTREAPPQITQTSLPLLETLTGPGFVAHGILRDSVNLESLTVNTALAKTEDALDLIEAANVVTLRAIQLRLTEWDDEVLLAITHRLRACRIVKVVFHFSQPSDDFLFNLGIEHLPLLAELHTLHVHGHAVPAVDEDEREPEGWFRDRPKEMRVAAVAPEEEACGEYLAAWTRYNGELRDVRLVEGRGWARRGGKRWGVSGVVEEA
ncbi:hypothetical protein C8R44DRAFT_861310 [Mycena epipterygia]|nr:hypothetical protein C8R44DRAFT_861310 [Mycena epipterygia]